MNADHGVKLHMAFWEDIRVALLNQLTGAGVTLEPAVRDDPRRVCYAFFDIQRKVIPQRVRHVHYSAELHGKLAILSPDVLVGVQLIETRSLAGEPLEEHFSERARNARSKDWLLSDWGIHHLHLHQNRDRDDLLYVCAEDDALYLIDIRGHVAMADVELLEIILRNWPALLEDWVAPWIRRREDDRSAPSAEEIDRLRRGGVMTYVTLSDGKAYLPRGGGVTTAGGFSSLAVGRAHTLLKRVRALQLLCDRRARIISRAVGRNEIHLRYDFASNQVIEVSSGEPLLFEPDDEPQAKGAP